MMHATELVLLVTTFGALYQWPHLRKTALRLMKWGTGFCFVSLVVLTALAALCDGLDNSHSLTTRSPLHFAAAAKDHARVAELLELKHVRDKIDVGRHSGLGLIGSQTPLYAAAQKGHTETVAALLKAGADPNMPSKVGLGLLGSRTPLNAAQGHLAITGLLQKYGATK